MRNLRPALLAGTVTAALLLSACGSDSATTAPAPVASVSSAAAPASGASSQSPSPRPSVSAPASPSSSAPAQEVVDDDAELDVEDQDGNGRSVAIDEIDLPSGDGFVAVYTRNGQLLGSTQVGSGSSSNLTVDLDTRIPATGEYRAVLFGDDGDGNFDAESDLRVVEDDDDDDDDAVDDDFDYRVR